MTNETKKSLKRPLDSINQHETKSKKFRTSLTLKELRRPTETSTVDVRSRNCPYLDTINRYDCYYVQKDIKKNKFLIYETSSSVNTDSSSSISQMKKNDTKKNLRLTLNSSKTECTPNMYVKRTMTEDENVHVINRAKSAGQLLNNIDHSISDTISKKIVAKIDALLNDLKKFDYKISTERKLSKYIAHYLRQKIKNVQTNLTDDIINAYISFKQFIYEKLTSSLKNRYLHTPLSTTTSKLTIKSKNLAANSILTVPLTSNTDQSSISFNKLNQKFSLSNEYKAHNDNIDKLLKQIRQLEKIFLNLREQTYKTNDDTTIDREKSKLKQTDILNKLNKLNEILRQVLSKVHYAKQQQQNN
ncbi:unnamed protein product, partial [Didymodactylos carnosus]